MKILFFNSNTQKIQDSDYEISLFPKASEALEDLAKEYPEHQFIVVTQKPGMFLYDFIDKQQNLTSKNVIYHILPSEKTHLQIADFIYSLNPDYCIAISYWMSPFDWLSINDSLIASKLEEKNIKVIYNNLKLQEICFNKWETKQFLEKEGFLTPKAIYFNHSLYWAERANKSILHNPYKELFNEKLKSMKFPIVIKSLFGFSSYGLDVAKTYSEALHFLSQKAGNEDKIIEEYIDGIHFGLEVYGNSAEYQIFPPFVFSLNKFGITSPKQSIKYGPLFFEDNNISKKYSLTALKEKVSLLSQLLEFSGSYQLDLIFSKGLWYFIEINPRISGLSTCYAALQNTSPLGLYINSLLKNNNDKTNFIKLCNIKIDIQPIKKLLDLKKNPHIKYICQIENKNAKQKRDRGYCELVIDYNFLETVSSECIDNAKLLSSLIET